MVQMTGLDRRTVNVASAGAVIAATVGESIVTVGNDTARLTANKASGANPFDDDWQSDPSNPFRDEGDEPMDVAAPAGFAPVECADSLNTFKRALLDLLNLYLRNADEGFLPAGGVNPKYVEKIKRDIAHHPTIARMIRLEADEENKPVIRWQHGGPADKAAIQRLLDAFRERHKGKGAFYKLLGQFDFLRAGYRVIGQAQQETLLRQVAQPARHAPGRADVVNVKEAARRRIAEHFIGVGNHEKPMADTAFAELIKYYANEIPQLNCVQKKVAALARTHVMHLNDQGLFDALMRELHQVKTDNRIERFSDGLAHGLTAYEKALDEQINHIVYEYSPDGVAQKLLERIVGDVLDKGTGQYAKVEPHSRNPFDTTWLLQRSPVVGQIRELTKRNHEALLNQVSAGYASALTDNLIKTVSTFSAGDFFQGKSLERVALNVAKLNNALCQVEACSTAFYQKRRGALTEHGVAVSSLDSVFRDKQGHLHAAIGDKLVDNNKAVLAFFNRDIAAISPARPDQPRAAVGNARQLLVLARQAADALGDIQQQSWPAWLEPRRQAMRNEMRQAVVPLQSAILDKVPPVKTWRETLQAGLRQAFQFTWPRIAAGAAGLGAGVALLAVAGFAWPLLAGLLAAGVVVLVGWVGKNLYDSLQCRRELADLRLRIDKQLERMAAV
ncbi:hypothetical protein [Paludibacterium sp.]|uniref:hypothetical protein n=1 Tax=Paludibacterium sp. TaxID=1917523 RepID=UPI0025FF08E3|nr:hypothetical protein [Paludibacterium sp.]MBV8646155.1 hypothetical protein [Paludibacterium sp.]